MSNNVSAVRAKIKEFDAGNMLRSLYESLQGSPASPAVARLIQQADAIGDLYESNEDTKHDRVVEAFARLMGNAGAALSRHDGEPTVKKFLVECIKFVEANESHLAVERVTHQLEYSKGVGAYEQAIEALREAAASETPDFVVLERLGGSRWITPVDHLYRGAETRTGKASDPGVETSRPVSFVAETSTGRVFFVDNAAFVADDSTIAEFTRDVNEEDDKAVAEAWGMQRVLDRCAVNGDVIRLPLSTTTSVEFDASTGELSEHRVGRGPVKAADAGSLVSLVMTGGDVQLGQRPMLEAFCSMVAEHGSIAELDFVTSVRRKGYTDRTHVMTHGGKVYLYENAPGMGKKSFGDFPAAEAVDRVRESLNYDVTPLLEGLDGTVRTNESRVAAARERIAKIEARLAGLVEEAAAKGVTDEARIEAAREVLEGRLAEARSEMLEGMAVFSPTKNDVENTVLGIENLGFKVVGEPTYLVFRGGGSNKYHVFVETNAGWFNGYGRIGYAPKLAGPMDEKKAMTKLRQKKSKGYQETKSYGAGKQHALDLN